MENYLTFALYYSNTAAKKVSEFSDLSLAFKRAAYTWAGCSVSRSMPANVILMSFSHSADIIQNFRLLAKEAKDRNMTFERGAIFSHSSFVPGKSGFGSLSVPRAPQGFGELQRLEGRFRSDAGLDVNYLAPNLQNLERLPWKAGAVLNIVGCNSGLGANPVAEQFAKTQKVITTGETGYASFSRSPHRYERISDKDEQIYLKAFFRNDNLRWHVVSNNNWQIDLWNEPLPQKTFKP